MSFNINEMDNMTKMMLFAFLGVIFAIMVLGFHASPVASPQLGAATRNPSSAYNPSLQGNQKTNPEIAKKGGYF